MTTRPRSDTRWWGWGSPRAGTELPEAAMTMLRERGIVTGKAEPIPALDQLSIEDPLPLPDAVRESVRTGGLFTDSETRIRHSGGQAIRDLLLRRSGRFPALPDAVVAPANPDEIGQAIEACNRENVAVIPFGGGTSVVGGVQPNRGEHRGVIALDLVALREFEIDRESSTARLGAGLRGAEAEALLARDGLTLGHFPQSFEYATIGGFAATRSSGQASTGYGRFDRLVTSLELISPVGTIRTPKTPHSAAGPSIKELILGSEGSLGVIPWVEVSVRHQPESRAWEAWVAPDFKSGCDLVRKWQQDGSSPVVVRVSDLEETAVSLALSLPGGLAGKAVERYLGLRGVDAGSLMILGFEGTRAEIRDSRHAVGRDLGKAGAARLGKGAGESWASGRFKGPYLREALLDLGLVVETVETAASWSEYQRSHSEIKEGIERALSERGMSAVVMCHLSHAYRDGASLYYTVIADSPRSDPIASWEEVKLASLETITGLGLTVSHHHATGRDHAPFLSRETGDAGLTALRALKLALDPRGIMNPGCLVLP